MANTTTNKKSGMGTWIILIIAAVFIWKFVTGGNSIEGMWQVEGVEMGSEYVGLTEQELLLFSFNEDGTGYISGDGAGYGFDYSYDDGSLIMIASGETAYAHCEIDGKKMRMEVNGETFQLKRR